MVGTSCTYMLDLSFEMEKNKKEEIKKQDEMVVISWDDLAFGRSLRQN